MNYKARMGEMRSVYKILVGKLEGKRPLRIWKVKLVWILEEWVGSVDWIHLAQDGYQWWSVVNMVMNLYIPLKVGTS
jgi:hypothetical protein